MSSEPNTNAEALMAMRHQIEAVNRAVIHGAALRNAFIDDAERGEEIDLEMDMLGCVQATVVSLFEMLVRGRHDVSTAIRILARGGWGKALLELEQRD